MIIRSKRPSHYTVIPNLILNDSSLDWKELGLLVYLLSKPDKWNVSLAHLVKQRKAGRDAILNMINKLKTSGFIVMKNKKEGGVDYLVYDTPQKPQPEKPLVGSGEPEPENTEAVEKQGFKDGNSPEGNDPQQGNPFVGLEPLTEKPLTEKPLTGYPHLVSTDIEVNTDKNKVTVTFDDFYSKYPKKLKRKDAKLKWDRLTAEKQQLAFDGIDKFTANKEKQFICAPDVYLNGERWDDEVTEAGNGTHQQPHDKQSAYLEELANA